MSGEHEKKNARLCTHCTTSPSARPQMSQNGTLFEYLNDHAQSLTNDMCSGSYVFKHALTGHVQLSKLLKAAGHDTAELDSALKSVEDNVQLLHRATQQAKARFSTEGVKAGNIADAEKECLQ